MVVNPAFSLATPAFGVTFNIGEIEGSFGPALSARTSQSAAKPNKNLVGMNNGDKGLSQTSDDNHLNFKHGETFLKVFKGIRDLELRCGDTGVFLRGKYWYDFKLKDEHREFKDVDDSGHRTLTKSSGAELLDAFIYHSYAIGDLPGSAHLGEQVVSQGESAFIRNGIDAINPIDITASRRPGSKIKEGLISVNMLCLSRNLTDNLSTEGSYRVGWGQTVVDNCSTFFSQPDMVVDDCDQSLTVLTNNKASINLLNNILAGVGLSVTSSPWDEGILVRRGPDRDTRDSGQYGFTLRYFADEPGTEFGAHCMNYHSRLPIFSSQGASTSVMATINDLATRPAAINPALTARVAVAATVGNSSHFIEYPEDIRMFSLSFSTTLPNGTAWSGGVNYRPNAPVQPNTTNILFADLDPMSIGGDRPYDNAPMLNGRAGQDLHDYRHKEITQLQTILTYFFDQVIGARRLTLAGEIGWTHVSSLENTSKTCYGRDPVFGPGPLPGTISGLTSCQALSISAPGTAEANNVSHYCENDDYTTSGAWDYRARVIWDYNDVFVGVNLKPSVAWSHDVDGYSPDPGANFEEGCRVISLGVDMECRDIYTASLSYINFFDGKYTTVNDRDLVTLSSSMNF